MGKKLLSITLALLLLIVIVPNVAMASNQVDVVLSAYDSYYGNDLLSRVEFTVFSGSRRVGSTDGYIRLAPGTYTVYANRGEYDEVSTTIRVTGPQRFRIDMSNRDNRLGIYKADVYSNRIMGKATPDSTVSLYKDNRVVSSTTSNRDGSYVINYEFSAFPNANQRLYPNVNTTTVVEGYTSANSPVTVYDSSGNYLGHTYSDSRGYYFINHRGVSNPRSKVILKDYRDRIYFEDLSNYSLLVENRYGLSNRYYLSRANIITGEVYIDKNPLNPPKIVEAAGGTDYIRGENASPWSTITIRDRLGNVLATKKLEGDGNFAIKTSRVLIGGEVLRITTANNVNLPIETSAYVTGDPGQGTYNFTTKFKIGSLEYTQTKDSKTETKKMDTVPYIVNGRTMLPIRFVAESLGYNVEFDNQTRNAVFVRGSSTLIINLDSREFYANGEQHFLSVDPDTVDGRIMLPVSEIGKGLGLTHGNLGEGKNIEWDHNNREVIIQVSR